MNIILLVTTLFIAPAGNVAPDTESIAVSSLDECVAMSSEIQRIARSEGKQVFTTCQRIKELKEYM